VAFLDPSESAALRALLGSVITIWKPDGFHRVVDMNTQPWTVLHPEHVELPASSLPANMPTSWLIAVLRMSEHDEPHRRAVDELFSRITPARRSDWPAARVHFLELVGVHADAVRRGLREALARPEPRHVTGRHVGAARLLALFGHPDDEALLASAASRLWIEDPPLPGVLWRPAGKAPAFGRYSYLELYLEIAFGSAGRCRILGEGYALEAERAEAAGEGGTASRYAYEAFLLAPDDPRIADLLARLNG
jgi:hypothetical protein